MINRNNIERFLTEFAQELARLRVTDQFHILMPGGAFLALENMRKTTEDIDFALIAPDRERDGVIQATVMRAEISKRKVRFSREFLQAIETVAQKEDLPEDWLNDEAASYYYDDAPCAHVVYWRSFSQILYVYLPTLEYQLALKIAAYRPKDQKDIQRLCKELQIKTRAQAQVIVSRFLLPEAIAFWEVEETLQDLFKR